MIIHIPFHSMRSIRQRQTSQPRKSQYSSKRCWKVENDLWLAVLAIVAAKWVSLIMMWIMMTMWNWFANNRDGCFAATHQLLSDWIYVLLLLCFCSVSSFCVWVPMPLSLVDKFIYFDHSPHLSSQMCVLYTTCHFVKMPSKMDMCYYVPERTRYSLSLTPFYSLLLLILWVCVWMWWVK